MRRNDDATKKELLVSKKRKIVSVYCDQLNYIRKNVRVVVTTNISLVTDAPSTIDANQ
ncbi:MAG: hypothetical protein ABI760_19000 [Ferruginibacter sp.]